MPMNAVTTSEIEDRDAVSQIARVAGLVERMLSTMAAGRALVVSLDEARRILGLQEVSLEAYGRMDRAKWELTSAVSVRAHAVVVGFHPRAAGDAERFARTIGSTLPAPILELVVAPRAAKAERFASGWVHRSTV